MKSIVQEASTIAKAVELGWKQAGEPQEFSVKILELPKHNFIGMTTQSAKVAIIYDHDQAKATQQSKTSQSERISKPKPQKPFKQEHEPSSFVAKESPKEINKEAPREPSHHVHSKKTVEKEALAKDATARKEPAEESEKKDKYKTPDSLWTSELVDFAQDWLKKSIQHMDRPDLFFTVEPQKFYLRITFNKPILDDATKEKYLFASLSTLMLATVKKQFRKALRGYKIVLTHAQ